MLYTWDEYNVAHQLYFNKKGRKEKKEDRKCLSLWNTPSDPMIKLWPKGLSHWHRRPNVRSVKSIYFVG